MHIETIWIFYENFVWLFGNWCLNFVFPVARSHLFWFFINHLLLFLVYSFEVPWVAFKVWCICVNLLKLIIWNCIFFEFMQGIDFKWCWSFSMFSIVMVKFLLKNNAVEDETLSFLICLQEIQPFIMFIVQIKILSFLQ